MGDGVRDGASEAGGGVADTAAADTAAEGTGSGRAASDPTVAGRTLAGRAASGHAVPDPTVAGRTVAVVGYASLDRAMALSAPPGPSGTALVRRRLSRPWPAPGGLAHLSIAMAEAGVRTEAISWVGHDADGERYRAELRRRGVGVDGIVAGGTRSPSTYLFYGPDGSTTCVYDPGDHEPGGLTPRQRRALGASAWVCLMVSPRAAVLDVLDVLDAAPERARLAWTVKADPDAFPPEVVRRILARASVVTFNTAERDFVARAVAPRPLTEAAPDAVLVETGGAGASVRFRAGRGAGPVAGTRRVVPVDVADTTGAGDVLCGGLVAHLFHAPTDVAGAVDAGIAAAARLLGARAQAGRREHDSERTSDR